MNLGSTTTDNLSLVAEIDKRIGMADATLARLRLTVRVWTGPKRDMDCTCLVGKKARQIPSEKHPPSWAYPDKIKVYNADVLSRACRPSMYTLLRQRTLRWLGYVLV